MAEFPRKADGRRIFTFDFKRETVAGIVSGEKTPAEVSRELGVSPSVQRNWMRLVERGGTTAVAAGEDVVPASRVRELEQQVKKLQRLVGKQAMTIEILEAVRDLARKVHTCSKGPVGDGPPDGGGLPSTARGTSHGIPPSPDTEEPVLPTSRGHRGSLPNPFRHD